MEKKKRKVEFTIIKNEPSGVHGSFGIGSINLSNVSPVIIDVEAGEAFVDMGAMHARSSVERGIKFLPNKEEVPNGKPYWIVWVTVGRKEEGPYIHGAAACEMTIDRETRRGYKLLPEHVNNMDRSIKGRFILEHMDKKSKQVLKEFLQNHDAGMWERSDEQLKTQLEG